MRILSRKVKGFVLVIIVVVSAYLTIVRMVNALKPNGLLKSFVVQSLRGSGSAGKFAVGDTLVVTAESDMGSAYDLQVCLNSSLVYDESGAFNGPWFNVSVSLVPPTFNASGNYSLLFEVYAYNTPIPGAFYFESATYAFEVASVETKLHLVSRYDTVMEGLFSVANLTDADGYPAANETVSFFLQLKSTHPLTDGWILLDSRVTDGDGTAKLCMGFSYPGPMAVEACHEGNANYGCCSQTVDVEVTSNMTDTLSFYYGRSFNGEHAEEMSVLDAGVLNLIISTSSPYALLPVSVEANYTSSSSLNTYHNYVYYYLDTLDNCVGSSDDLTRLSGEPAGPPYNYTSSFRWADGPDAIGTHTLIGGVVATNSTADLTRAQKNGAGIIASPANLTLNIQRCPSNLALYFPEACYSDVLPVSVALSKPRVSGVNNVSEFTACSLASRLDYDGAGYFVDKPINASVPVGLYVNGTLNCSSTTGSDGLASFPLQLNLSEARLTLNLTCAADASSTLFQSSSAVRDVTLTRINVSDTVTGASSAFKLDCTVNGQGASNSVSRATVYVGTNSSVQLGVRLPDSSSDSVPVRSAPASVLIGKPTTPARNCTDASGWVPTVKGSTLLRVACLYNIYPLSDLASCDVNRDGKVNVIDSLIVAKAFGALPGTASYSWLVDVDFNLKIDAIDLLICGKSYGASINYTRIADYSLVSAAFSPGGQTAQLNRWGCVAVPPEALGVTMSVGGSPVMAMVEFFNCTYQAECCTDNTGQAGTTWVPPETGNCSATQPVRLEPYFALAWLPQNFLAVTSRPSNVTSIKAQLCQAAFVNVDKRPVSLALTNSSYAPYTAVERPLVDLYVRQYGETDNFGSSLIVGYQPSGPYFGERRIYVEFNISDIPADSTILSARIKAYCDDASSLPSSGRQYEIDRITTPWDPNTITYNTPVGYAGYTSLVHWAKNERGWMVWDVTPDVRLWYSRSEPNYGHVIWDHAGNPQCECYCSLASDRAGNGAAWPVLEVTYVPNACLPVGLEAELVDGATGEPMSGASVTFSNNCSPTPVSTDSSGAATTQWPGPSTSAAYTVTADYFGDAMYESASGSLCLDFRTNTSLGINGMINDEVIFVGTHETLQFDCSVNPPIAASEGVQVFVNGSCYTNTTLGLDRASFSWSATSPGVYYINVTYGGD